MRALGLDPSLKNYGFAIFDSDAPIPSLRRVVSGRVATVSSTVPVVRFMHFRALVADLLRKYRVDVVGIESPAYSAGPFSERHFGLMMFSLESIFERRKDAVLFDPTTVKLMTGKGNASKADIIQFVKLDTMSTDPISNDEADAYCIAKFAARFTQLRRGQISPDDLSDGEKRVFLTRTIQKKKTDGSVSIKRTAHAFRSNSRFFEFSLVPKGSVNLPDKAEMDPKLIKWLENEEWQKQKSPCTPSSKGLRQRSKKEKG